nr:MULTISPECIES: ABC transporter substrate-binding protein [Protofrankia]
MFMIGRRSLLSFAVLAAALGSLTGLFACATPRAQPGRAGSDPCTSPGVTDSEVKIGLLFDDSGPTSAAYRTFRAGVEARLGVTNAAGGVHGRKVVYAWRDDAGSPDGNRAGARELVQNEGVFGILETAGVVVGSAQYLDDLEVPVVGLAGDVDWNNHGNMFSWHYYSATQGSSSVWGDFVRSQGGTRALVVNTELSDATEIFYQKLRTSLQAAGIRVEANFTVTAKTTSFGALAAQMKAARLNTLAGIVLRTSSPRFFRRSAPPVSTSKR